MFEVYVCLLMYIKRTVLAKTPEDFGEQIKKACDMSLLPIGNICAIAGMTRECLNAIQNGKYTRISEDKFNALCYAFEKKPEDFGIDWVDGAFVHQPKTDNLKKQKPIIEKPINMGQMHHILKVNQTKRMRLTENLIRSHIAKGDFEEWSESVCGTRYRAYQLEKHYPWRFERVEEEEENATD